MGGGHVAVHTARSGCEEATTGETPLQGTLTGSKVRLVSMILFPSPFVAVNPALGLEPLPSDDISRGVYSNVPPSLIHLDEVGMWMKQT